MKKQLITTLAISALLNLTTFSAFAADCNAEADKCQKKVKPHSHPVDKGTAPVSEEHQGPHDKAKSDDSDNDKADKHSHPKDGK